MTANIADCRQASGGRRTSSGGATKPRCLQMAGEEGFGHRPVWLSPCHRGGRGVFTVGLARAATTRSDRQGQGQTSSNWNRDRRRRNVRASEPEMAGEEQGRSDRLGWILDSQGPRAFPGCPRVVLRSRGEADRNSLLRWEPIGTVLTTLHKACPISSF